RTAATLPDPESNEPEAVDWSAGEVQLDVSESSNRVACVVRLIFTVILSVAIFLIRGYRGSFAARGARNRVRGSPDGLTQPGARVGGVTDALWPTRAEGDTYAEGRSGRRSGHHA